jgi:hypothetical protein
VDIRKERFGKLVVCKRVGTNKSRNILWECLCDCGERVIVASNHLRSGHTKSCGCYAREQRAKDLKNKKFGRLEVMYKSDILDRDNNILWYCKCSCGNTCVVSSRNLIRGATKSCGCYAKERRLEANKSKLLGKKLGRLLVVSEVLNNKEHRGIRWNCLCDCGNMIEVTSASLNSRTTNSCGCLQKEIASKICSLRIGKNSPSWKGGISKDLYCTLWSDKDYKADIRLRDNNLCQNPYCYNTSKCLVLHHINYDKKGCHPSNLITVCVGCNVRANKDRKWHTEWYQAIMSKKFKYTY